MQRHHADCSFVPEETPEDGRLCFYEYKNQEYQLAGSKKNGSNTPFPTTTTTTTTTTTDNGYRRCYCRQDLCNYL